jgi:hypothetical protein
MEGLAYVELRRYQRVVALDNPGSKSSVLVCISRFHCRFLTRFQFGNDEAAKLQLSRNVNFRMLMDSPVAGLDKLADRE